MLHLAVRSLVTVMFSTLSQLSRSDDFALCAGLIQVRWLVLPGLGPALFGSLVPRCARHAVFPSSRLCGSLG